MTSPAVGKVMEAGLVALYIGLVTTALFGGWVPDYRATAGDAVADRTLAAAVERVQQAVPPNAAAVDATRRVSLPDTIAGAAYRVETDGRTLRLSHPDPAVGSELRLALPPAVGSVSGEWESGADARVAVESTGDGLAVRLEEAP